MALPRTAPAGARRGRRGRPQKYGRPSQVVAVTLPLEVVRALRRSHSDIGWAIVSLVEKTQPAPNGHVVPEAELVEVGRSQFLIVLNSHVLRSIPGVQMVPLSDTQAFLALDPGKGMGDLELAVGDAIERRSAPDRERQALTRLLGQLRKWRRDKELTSFSRSIIIVAPKRSKRVQAAAGDADT